MTINTIEGNGVRIAVVKSEEILISDVQSALDLLATVSFDTGCDRMIIDKQAICEDFFHLSTRLAGEVLQKFSNYRMKLAIIGDFTVYSSKSLKDFIFECNKGKDIFFLADEKSAVEKLSSV